MISPMELDGDDAAVLHRFDPMELDDPSTPPKQALVPARREPAQATSTSRTQPELDVTAPTPSKRKKGKRKQEQLIQHNYHYGPAAPEPSKGLDQGTPYALLGYLQVLFNLSLLLIALYLLVSLIWTVLADVQDKMAAYANDVREEIYTCSKHYQQTGCGTPNVIDLAVQHCEGWRQCMERDPMKVGRVRVGAETFAEILNGFVDVISWKTMIFLCAFSGILIFAANSAISHKRAQYAPPPHQHSLHPHSHAAQHINPLLYQAAPYWLAPQSMVPQPASAAGHALEPTGPVKARTRGWFG